METSLGEVAQGEVTDSWRIRPRVIYRWPKDCTYTMFVDENGNADLKVCQRALYTGESVPAGERYFSVTGLVIKRDDWPDVKRQVTNLKMKYWPGGLFHYHKGQPSLRRVVLHAYDINSRSGPFSPHVIPYDMFTNDLADVIGGLPCTLFSVFIDKSALTKRYGSRIHPYTFAMALIFERFSRFFLKKQQCTGNVILEARGKHDDRRLLHHLKGILDDGTDYVTPKEFARINGIYFNPKWHQAGNAQQSYLGLELADLAAYSLYRFCHQGIHNEFFEAFRSKLHGYPKYNGKGLKRFPQ